MANRARASLTLANSANGEPLTAGLSYKEADGATTLAQALYAANSGGGPVSMHATNGRGEIDRYAPYAQRATYVVDGDTAAQPITFDVDPADSLALGADGETVTAGYRSLARLKVNSLEAQIRNPGGPYYLEAYADNAANIRGATPSEDPDIAWTRVLAAITAAGGAGTIILGPHRYLAATSAVTMIPNIVIRGSGIDATVIQHRDASQQPCLDLRHLSNVHVRDLTCDGNRTNNNGATTGFIEGEISIWDSNESSVVGCRITNFNFIGINGSGVNQTFAHNRIDGPSLGSYVASINSTTQRNCGGLLGIFCNGSVLVRNTLIFANSVSGSRANGIAYGGVGLRIVANDVRDCHRDDWAVGVGGGQIALTLSLNAGMTAIDAPPEQVLIVGNTIGPTTVNAYATGIEANPVYGLTIVGNTISGQPGYGIQFNGVTSATLSGCEIIGCAVGFSASQTLPTTGFTVTGVAITNSTIQALNIGSGATGYTISHCVLAGNAVNLFNASTSLNYTMWGNRALDGDPLPVWTSTNYAAAASSVGATYAAVVRNAGVGTDASNTGSGLWSIGGTTGFDFALRLSTPGGSDRFAVFGNGWLKLYAAGARIQADFSSAPITNRTLFQTTTVNGVTTVGAIPNGTGTQAGWNAYNALDPDNAGVLILAMAATAAQIHSAKTGTGTYQPLEFWTSGAKQAAIDAAGLMTLTAGQLAFPATENPSSDANTLDTYRERAWTPTLGGNTTYTTQEGTYTKVGRLVSFRLHLKVNVQGTGSVNTISGLPYTAANGGAAAIGYFSGSATNYISMMGFLSGSTITIYAAAAATATMVGATFFQAGAEIYISGSFEV